MRTALFLLFLPLTAFAGAKDKAIESAMEKIWEKGDMSVIDEAYEEEIGNEVKRFVQENRDLYPDLQIEITDSIIKGNRFVTVWRATGTHTALKKKVVLEGVSVRTREGGKFTEERMFYNQKTIYDQLGFEVVPPDGISPFTTAMVERKAEPMKPAGEKKPMEDGEMEKMEEEMEKMDEEAEMDEAPSMGN